MDSCEPGSTDILPAAETPVPPVFSVSQGPGFLKRLQIFGTRYLVSGLGEWGRGLLWMSALASLVPLLDDPWISGVFLGFSGWSLRQVLREKRNGPQTPVTIRPSEESAKAELLLDLQDQMDRSAGGPAELGKLLPLIIPQVWFGASLLLHASAGRWYLAGVSLAGTVVASMPIFLRAREALGKMWDRWKLTGPGVDFWGGLQEQDTLKITRP